MTAAAIQAAVNAALGLTASVAGDNFVQYRPNGAGNPIVSGNIVNSALLAWATTDPTLKTPKQSVEGKSDWYGAFDPTLVAVGDYLVGNLYTTAATFFVQAIERFNAPHLIRCNHTVTLSRMQSAVQPGLSTNYGGDVPADAAALLTSWPASVLIVGNKGAANMMGLPNDTHLGTFTILLPASVPVTLYNNDTLIDEEGNRYGVNAAEFSPLGWRLTADQWKQG